tara:strand:- start:26 stop:130 length:105 start_codon:yes stop_codon:yes gene_type:complete
MLLFGSLHKRGETHMLKPQRVFIAMAIVGARHLR